KSASNASSSSSVGTGSQVSNLRSHGSAQLPAVGVGFAKPNPEVVVDGLNSLLPILSCSAGFLDLVGLLPFGAALADCLDPVYRVQVGHFVTDVVRSHQSGSRNWGPIGPVIIQPPWYGSGVGYTVFLQVTYVSAEPMSDQDETPMHPVTLTLSGICKCNSPRRNGYSESMGPVADGVKDLLPSRYGVMV
ncbi:unnamed protein product, partial [Polarella glacialis]